MGLSRCWVRALGHHPLLGSPLGVCEDGSSEKEERNHPCARQAVNCNLLAVNKCCVNQCWGCAAAAAAARGNQRQSSLCHLSPEQGWGKGLLQIHHGEENRPGGNFLLFSLAEIAGFWLKAHPTAVPSTAWSWCSLWAEHLHSSARGSLLPRGIFWAVCPGRFVQL